MRDDDVDYYRRRADLELERAKAATLPTVAAAHHRLADAYRQRVVAAEAESRPGDA